MGREIRLVRALADEGYQYRLNDGKPPIPRDAMVTFAQLPEAPRLGVHGGDREGRDPGDPAPRHAASSTPTASATTTCSCRPRRRRWRSSGTPRTASATSRRRRAGASVHRRVRRQAARAPAPDAGRSADGAVAAGRRRPAASAVRALLQRTTGAGSGSTARSSARSARGLVVLLGVGPDDDEAIADAPGPARDRAPDLRRCRRPDEPVAGRRRRARSSSSASSRSTPTPGAAAGPGSPARRAPELAERLYLRFAAALRELGVPVATGRFGAVMAVELVNDGPFTIWLDTADR